MYIYVYNIAIGAQYPIVQIAIIHDKSYKHLLSVVDHISDAINKLGINVAELCRIHIKSRMSSNKAF